MKLEVLMSCMHQTDDHLVAASRLTGDAVIINQCAQESYSEYPTEAGLTRMFSTTQRGLTKSRNMAIREARADICMICDDDEQFEPDYQDKILQAYRDLPQADIIIFKIGNVPTRSFEDRVQQLRFPQTMKVCSVQISFRRQRLLDAGVAFDELLGAGTGNGAEEELKFLLDSQRAGLTIYYVPVQIASVIQDQSVWFNGFTEEFFENRGATTRYILGAPLACIYGLYYILRKRKLYQQNLSAPRALRAIFRGILNDKISKQAKTATELEFFK